MTSSIEAIVLDIPIWQLKLESFIGYALIKSEA